MIARKPYARALATVAVCGVLSCDEQPVAPLDVANYVGHYELAQVDGHELGWYHQLQGVDCSAAFTSGRLSIAPDRAFRLQLYFKFRCLGTDPFDGEDAIEVTGNLIRPTEELIVLNGWGPDVVGPGIDKWSLDVRPLDSGEHVEVRFWGLVRQYWADPILRMGPKETFDYACIIQACQGS